MKKIILNFKKTIRFLVSIIVSSEFAFVYVLLGTISQVAHTYYLLENISSLTGNWKTLQSVMLSIFISSSLLYWVAISDKDDKTDEGIKNFKRANFAVWLFTIIEIFINVYYYSKHLVIDKENYQVYEFIFALMIACLIPITIKLFSSNIRSKYWILEFEDDKNEQLLSEENNIQSFSEEKLLEIIQPMITNFEESLKDIQDVNQDKIDELINNKLNTLNQDIDKQISDSYSKNQELFLKQFESKAKLLSNNYLQTLKDKI